MTLPFLHLALLAVAAAAFAVARRLGLRPLPALAIAVAIGALAVAVDALPWRGTYHLTAYGICMLLAFLVAYAVGVRRARRLGIGEPVIAELTLIALIAGLIGARLRFVLENRAFFVHGDDGAPRSWYESLAAMCDLDSGGMVWYGGLILASAACLVRGRMRRLPLLPLSDALAPAALVGLSIGRIGCWFNGCCYGAATTLPWAAHPDGQAQGIHPTQLYESLAAAVLAALLMLVDRRSRPAGVVTGLACIGYGAWRCFNESLRGDHHPGARAWLPLVGDLSTSQATSIAVVLIGLAVLIAGLVRRTARSSAS